MAEGMKLALELAREGADKAGCDGWRAQEKCRQIIPLLEDALTPREEAADDELRSLIYTVTHDVLPLACDTTGVGVKERARLQVEIADGIIAALPDKAPSAPAGEGWFGGHDTLDQWLDAMEAVWGRTRAGPEGQTIIGLSRREMRSVLLSALRSRTSSPEAPADALGVAVKALERIGTVDMGGGFLGALACRQVANEALSTLKAGT